MPRKPRNDRNHIIYQLTNKITGESYIGITVVKGRAFNKSLKIRWEGHCYKAYVELKEWAISINIRTYGINTFQKQIIEIVRGKPQAHKREVELINSLQPELNTHKAQIA